MEIYQVKSGDSLSAIARDALGDIDLWPRIAKLNNLVAPYKIFPGMQLMLPESQTTPAPATTPKPVNQVKTEPTQPTHAGIGFNLEPKTMAWLALGAFFLFVVTDDK